MAKAASKSAPKPGASVLKLKLPAPRKATGEPSYGIFDYIEKQFLSVVLIKGNSTVQIVGKGAKNVGNTVLQYIGATMLGAFSGRGDLTEGAVIWAAEHSKNPQLARLAGYTIRAESKGRGGIYEAPFEALLEVVRARAEIFRTSLEKFPRTRGARETLVGDDTGEEVDLIL